MICVCDECSKEFKRKGRPKGKFVFCDRKCYALWQESHKNSGNFSPGHQTWNKNVKGIHLSPGSEFKKGQTCPRLRDVGTVRDSIEQRKGKTYVKQYVKVSNTGNKSDWKHLSIKTWEDVYGELIEGDVVHHIDEDRNNNDISNLLAIPRHYHPVFHRRKDKYYLSADEICYWQQRYIERNNKNARRKNKNA